MKKIRFIIILSVLISLIGCDSDKESVSDTKKDVEIIELREDFNAEEFKEAIIGKWQSVFEQSGFENVIYLELNANGNAKITLDKDSVSNDYQGDYTIDFTRQPMKGSVTFGEITISTQNKIIKLSRVNFGLHNAMPADSMYLRIDESPHGVLDRVK